MHLPSDLSAGNRTKKGWILHLMTKIQADLEEHQDSFIISVLAIQFDGR